MDEEGEQQLCMYKAFAQALDGGGGSRRTGDLGVLYYMLLMYSRSLRCPAAGPHPRPLQRLPCAGFDPPWSQ